MVVKASSLGVILVLAAAPGAWAQTSQQFDLACEGRRQVEMDGEWQPHTYGFRVDLTAGRWCWNTTCDRTFEIVEATPDRLVFSRSDRDDRQERSWSDNEVSRQTGRHEQWSAQTYPLVRSYKVEGQCRPTAFSGFPAALF